VRSASEAWNLVRESGHNVQTVIDEVLPIRSYPPPSTFALLNNFIDYQTKDQQLLIHRPSECVGPPLEMKKEHYHWTLEFIHEMSEIYRSEPERQQVFNEKIRELFGEELRVIHLDDNDGVLECNVRSKSVLRLLVEIKNEIGTGGCDPTVQGGASYAKYYTQKKNGEMLQ
ncbi:7021_t:CDS:2, partial [Racocetra fulgida]